MRTWAQEVGSNASLPEARIFDLQVTVSEATANAIEHAASAVELTAWLLPDRLIVEVTNDGVFQPGLYKDDSHRRRGLGLPLIVSLADQVHVSRLPSEKTQVSLTFFVRASDVDEATGHAPRIIPLVGQSPAGAQPGAGSGGLSPGAGAFGWLLLPIPLFVVLTALMWALGDQTAHDSQPLLIAMNTLLISAASVAVAFLAGDSYLRTGSRAVLLLGAGALALALAYLLNGTLITTRNVSVTFQNGSVLLAGVLFTISGIISLAGWGRESSGRRKGKLLLVYLGPCALAAFLWAASASGALPAFYVQDAGYTALRQVVASLAVLALFTAALSYLLLHRRNPSRFLMLAAGSFSLFFLVFGLLVITKTTPGTPVAWVTRAASWAAGLYLLAGVISLVRSGSPGLTLERSLRELEGRYGGLADVTPDAILVHSQGTCLYANPGAARLLGVSGADKLMGRHVPEFLHPDTREASLQRIAQACSGGIAAPADEKYLRDDGGVVDVQATSVRVEFGGRLAVQTVARDITERKEAEERLAYLASFPDLNPNPITEIDVATGRVEFANVGARRLFPDLIERGREHPWLSGAREQANAVDATDQPVVREVTVGSAIYHQELHLTPDQHRLRIYGVDITERKHADEALRESGERSAFLVRLNDALRPLSDPVAVQETASRLLGEHLKADRAGYFEIQGEDVVIERDWAPSVPHLSGRFPGAAFGEQLLDTYRSGRMVVMNDIAEEPLAVHEREAYSAIQVAAQISIPLIKDGRFVGGLTVHSAVPRVWTAQEMGLLAETADRTWAAVERAKAESELRESKEKYKALAAENERLYRQQLNIAENLQFALLNIPSEIGPLRIGHLYRSATEAARIGGDFYDVFEVKDGQIAVLIGDVSGHGIEAARTATLVKDVVHAFAHQSLRAHEVLRHTNRLLLEKNLLGFVTAFLGILDQNTGRLRYSLAGHPEALLRRVSGEVERLGLGTSPLGVYPDPTWKTHEIELGADDILLLYTDGVIEARFDGQFFGENRLERVLKRKRVSPEKLPQLILDHVLAFSGGTLQDDVAVLAVSLHEVLVGASKSPFKQEKLLS